MKTKLLLSLATAQILLATTELPVVIVNGNDNNSSTEVSSTKIDRTKIDNTMQGNGFISSILQDNPNIKVTDISKNSNTAGEITPGKISIHNAPFYDNNFMIDGVSNNSLIDPNISAVQNPYDVPGNENQIFLDLDLIEEVTVYDSNISAEYGNFTGGVIDAKTIRAGAEPKIKFSYGHTSDSLTKLHIANKEEFNKAKGDNNQPKFKKNFYNINVSTPLNDTDGMVLSYNRKESTIPGAYFGGFKDKERLNESYFAKFSHYFKDDSILDLTGTYSPYESTHFNEYVKDSDTKIKGGGYSLKANYEKQLDNWELITNLAYNGSRNERESLDYNKKWLKTNTKDWGVDNLDGQSFSNEGGSGNVEKTQQGITYNLKLKSDNYEFGDFSNKLKTGFDVGYDNAEYDRKNDTFYYNNPTLNHLVICNGDYSSCVPREQYFTERRIYKAEKAEASIVSTSAYFENQMEYGIFELTPGVRFDYNNYLENFDIAYRLNGSIKPFKDESTVLFAGANRYYGKSFLGFKLREARIPTYDEYRGTSSNILESWGSSSDKDSNKYVFSNLDTPYTDEISIGIKQDFSDSFRASLKYVKRDAKKSFSRHKGDYQVFTMPDGVNKGYYKPTYFGNGGYSSSEIYSIVLEPVKPIRFSNVNFGYMLATSWEKSSSNIDTYDDLIENDDTEQDVGKVYYDGRFIDADKIPLEKDPKSINLHLNFAFDEMNLFNVPVKMTLNNIINYNLKYHDIKITDSNNKRTYVETLPDGSTRESDVYVYEKVKFDDAMTLDMKLVFDFKVASKQHLVFSTEINNVFDKVQNVEKETNKYQVGRQFWFNVAYNF
ncbi:hypothetical protein CRU92_03960 [Arcobacter sp. FW59]|nr:hypothetical protein CRU92_03960 [Arcobacter sp. FW59]